MHQVLLANVYNKVIFLHFNPQSSKVHIFELDPTFSYKNQHAITIPPTHLIQMQIMDNLITIHDIDARTTQ